MARFNLGILEQPLNFGGKTACFAWKTRLSRKSLTRANKMTSSYQALATHVLLFHSSPERKNLFKRWRQFYSRACTTQS